MDPTVSTTTTTTNREEKEKEKERKKMFIQIKNIWYYNVYIHKYSQ